jgi:hypothetical protein
MSDKENRENNPTTDENDEKNPGPSPDTQKSGLNGTSYEAENVLENAEPWDPIETKIVIGSFLAALICLIIFGYLINVFILH